jgi:lipoprotein-releasing system permease protein
LEPLNNAIEGKAVISDWRENNSALFKAMELDRIGVSIVASLVTLVALFNIVSSLIMLVRAKTRDIAVLRTMGMSARAVQRVFVSIGMVIGGLGVFVGLVVALFALHFLTQIVAGAQGLTGQKIWDPSIRFLNEIPTRTDPLEVILIVGATLFACFLFTLYPAFRAAKTDPVTVLRYE